MPRKKSKQYPRALMASDLLRLSPKGVRKRVGMKRRLAPLTAPEPEVKPGGLTAEDLIRWRKPEKPIEIIE